MSKEAVEEFFAKIPEDDNLQQKLVSILQADIDHRQETAKLAQEYGFDITAEELSEEVKKTTGRICTAPGKWRIK